MSGYREGQKGKNICEEKPQVREKERDGGRKAGKVGDGWWRKFYATEMNSFSMETLFHHRSVSRTVFLCLRPSHNRAFSYIHFYLIMFNNANKGIFISHIHFNRAITDI